MKDLFHVGAELRPYPGLRPFEPHEAEIFFGREGHVDRLIEILRREHFLAVLGPSGCGKSSLVRAGLLPALAAGWLGTGSQWRIAVLRPGDQPFRALTHALLNPQALAVELLVHAATAVGEEAPPQARLSPLFEAELRRGPRGLLTLVQEARRSAPATAAFNLLVLVDQFEELFRYANRGTSETDEADAFVDLLLRSRADTDANIFPVLTMRTDFLGDCVRFLDLPEAINHAQYLTPRLTRDQMFSAIVGPARLFHGDVEESLANELMNEVSADSDQLPILQHALAQMWVTAARRDEKRTIIARDDLLSIGSLIGALDRHAEQVLAELTEQVLAELNPPEEGQRLAKRVFQRLTASASGGREVRRPSTVSELAAVAATSTSQVEVILNHFRQDGCNFVTSPDAEPSDDSIFDISHESLIRRWDRLRHWVEEEAESAEWYRRVEDRKRIGGAHLVGAELQSALRAQASGQWNEAWAERYATEKQGIRVPYKVVTDFLEHSRDELLRKVNRSWRSLTDLSYVERRCAEGIQELLSEYDVALRSPGLGDDEWAQLAGFARFVRAECQLLAAHPELTYQQALNLPDATPPAAAARRAAQVETRPRFRWVNKPQMPSPCVRTLHGHRDYINGCDVAADGETMVSASSDTDLKIWDTATGEELCTLATHASSIEVCNFSPDGKRIVSAARDGEIKIWDAVTRSELRSLTGHTMAVVSCRFSPDGTRLVSVSLDGTLKIWQPDTGLEPQTLPSRATPLSCAFCPDGRWIVSGDADGRLTLWDVSAGEEVRTIGNHQKAVTSCVFTPDGRSLLSSSEDFTIKRWDVGTGELTNTYGEWQETIWALAVSPDGTRLAAGAQDGSITFYDVQTADALARVTEHLGQISTLAFFPDGSRVLSGSWDRVLKVWSVETAEQLDREQRGSGESGDPRSAGQWGYMISCCCSPDGAWFAAGSSDGSIRLWDARTGACSGVVPLHRDYVMACAFSPDSRWIVSGSWDGSVKLFDVARRREGPALTLPQTVSTCGFSRRGNRMFACSAATIIVWQLESSDLCEICTWQSAGDRFVSCAIDPDGGWIVGVVESGTFIVWDIESRAPIRSFVGDPGVVCCALSSDGRQLATGSDSAVLRIWDVVSGAQVQDVSGHSARVVSCNFSPDGRRLVSGSWDQTVRVQDLDGPDVMVLSGHADQLQDTCFNAAGTRIFSVAVDGTARLWDSATGAWLGSLLWPSDSVSLCTYSPDRRYFLTASHRHALKLWNGITGEPERVLRAHQDTVRACDVSIRGQIVSASADGTLKLWDMTSLAPLRTLTGHTGPVQSCAFSPDGSWIVSGGWDNTVRLWDAQSGDELARLPGHDGWVQVVLVAAGGGRIVSCSHDRTAVIWDTQSRQRLYTLQGHDTVINVAALSADGTRVVTGSEDGILIVWDIQTGRAISRFAAHTGAVRDCAFTDRVLSGSQDGTLRIWDTERARDPITLTGHSGPVLACRFFSDGKHVLSGGADQYVRLWDSETGALIGQYWAAAPVQSIAWQTASRRIAAGDAAGKLHLLELEGALS